MPNHTVERILTWSERARFWKQKLGKIIFSVSRIVSEIWATYIYVGFEQDGRKENMAEEVPMESSEGTFFEGSVFLPIIHKRVPEHRAQNSEN